jgi:hypothetical protein
MSVRYRLTLGWIVIGGLALLGGPPVLAGAAEETYECAVSYDWSTSNCANAGSCSFLCPQYVGDRCDAFTWGGSKKTCFGAHQS